MDNVEPKVEGAVIDALRSALEKMRKEKPNDRSERDRYVAICITDLEKLLAVYGLYCT
jgi:hypothetical protein